MDKNDIATNNISNEHSMKDKQSEIDCLLIGFNEGNFIDYVTMLEMMGKDSGAYNDAMYHFVEYNNSPKRALDLINHLLNKKTNSETLLHNNDFLNPTIIYLGTYLSRMNLNFDYINLFHLEKDKLKRKLLENNYLTIAITTTLYVSVHHIIEIISFIKKYNNNSKIIIGGPYINTQLHQLNDNDLKDLFKYLTADFYVMSSEGENALSMIIKNIKSNTDFSNIDNIAYPSDNEYIFTKKSNESNELSCNLPDYSLFPKSEIGEFVSTRLSKSCPFSCAYCGFSSRAGKFVSLDLEHIEQELDSIKNIGTITNLTFIDDTLNVPLKKFIKILEMMIHKKYNFKWNCNFRSDFNESNVIELMKNAGCEGVFLGIESGSPQILEKMNKKINIDDYYKSISDFKKNNILTHANFIIGFPGETKQTFEETLNFIKKAKPDFYRAQLWYADPMTPIMKHKLKYNIIGSSFEWTHYTLDSQTANNYIKEMFFSINDSIWLPQNGFEFWSVFYLLKKGMSLSNLKGYLITFRNIIRNKIEKKPYDQLLEDIEKYVIFRHFRTNTP